MTRGFFIVDVFAERAYAGNPLAVVVSAQAMADPVMQAIAVETNYSETTFVTPVPEGNSGYPVRIFTPAREIAFAGHPILGTAWVVRHHVAQAATVRLNLAIGQVPVRFETAAGEREVAWFVAPPVSLGATCAADRIAPAIGLAAQDIDTRTPAQVLSAGTAALIVPLRDLAALRCSRLDLTAFAPLARDGFPPLVYLFCRETRDRGDHVTARFFFEAHGVREDPATGNGAAFLGAYLLAHGESEVDLRIAQGHEVGRPSLVMLRARRNPMEVQVGGGVIPVVQGELVSSVDTFGA
jgi:trans-2,3-dihydro-3-hydroxyanthranilate isomerase